MKRTFLTLLLILITVSLFSQDEYTINIDGSKLFFSVGGNVHWKYFNVRREGIYKNKLLDYHIQRNKDIGHNPAYRIEVNLPDSLFKEQLKIKKGFYAVNVDSLISFKFMIHNFYTEAGEGGGNFGPYFNVPKQFNVDYKKLFIVSSDRTVFDKIKPTKYKANKDNNINNRIADLTNDFIINNEWALHSLILHEYANQDSVNIYKNSIDVSSRYSLMPFKVNENCYYTIGKTNLNHPHSFFSVYFPKSDNFVFLTNTRLINTFAINNDIFFYYGSNYGHTGASSYIIVVIKEDQLIEIFNEGAYSM
jgi:hypothetical protein